MGARRACRLLIGHANNQSTAHYAHLDDAHVLDAAEQIAAAIEQVIAAQICPIR